MVVCLFQMNASMELFLLMDAIPVSLLLCKVFHFLFVFTFFSTRMSLNIFFIVWHWDTGSEYTPQDDGDDAPDPDAKDDPDLKPKVQAEPLVKEVKAEKG